MSAARVLFLWCAVHLAALAVGAWVVWGPDATRLLAWPALMLAVAAIPLRRLGQP